MTGYDRTEHGDRSSRLTSLSMLDPRIYRAVLVPVALALVVLAFSLSDQQGGLSTDLAPDAFNAQNAYSTMNRLAQDYPNRGPGSASDNALASQVSQVLARYGYATSDDSFSAHTADGIRTIQTITAVRPGFSGRPIVVVAHRDARGSPAVAEMSGTATLLELARVLAGRTLSRTVMLVSTSGSIGAAGTTALARTLGSTPDAVFVLGDLAGARIRYPTVVPWSNGPLLAPAMLRNTVAGALATQAGIQAGGLGVGGQFARLAFPLTIAEQGPFGAHGQASVLLSASSERGPGANDPGSLSRLTGFGRAALQTISALEDGRDIPAPGPYLVWDKKVVPAWAIRLLVLTLILPVLAAGIDGYARARRRGHAVGPWAAWVLAGAVPFVLATALVYGLKLTGLLHPTPPGPVDANVVPPHGAGIAIMVLLVGVVALSLAFLRPALGRLVGARGTSANGGTTVALPLVMCVVTLTVWIANPFAAALVVPALNLWMWAIAPDLGLPRSVRAGLLVLGIVPPVLILGYYALTLGVGPVGLAWSLVLMVAGGHLGLLAALEWSLVLGCTASAVTTAFHAARRPDRVERPITVRGPATYAGPGSLGGTKSAIRR
jgi:hypothetical protein